MGLLSYINNLFCIFFIVYAFAKSPILTNEKEKPQNL